MAGGFRKNHGCSALRQTSWEINCCARICLVGRLLTGIFRPEEGCFVIGTLFNSMHPKQTTFVWNLFSQNCHNYHEKQTVVLCAIGEAVWGTRPYRGDSRGVGW